MIGHQTICSNRHNRFSPIPKIWIFIKTIFYQKHFKIVF